MSMPTIVTVPCLSGAPWDTGQLAPLAAWPIRTMRLPEGLDDVEAYADFLAIQVHPLDSYVLVGDSFGASVALALATRRPPGLKALVLSGGFAASPVRSPVIRALIGAARFLPGPLYRQLTLRLHARALASPHDERGQVPWSRARSRELFLRNTPHRSYVARTRAALSADHRGRLQRIEVPTLIITPSHDRLIGAAASVELVSGIPDAREVVLEGTGHMLRFTHPAAYAEAVRHFLYKEVLPRWQLPESAVPLAEEVYLRARELDQEAAAQAPASTGRAPRARATARAVASTGSGPR
jgi:pimeloyl-ACP methyl ester carboxylesterase